MHLHPSEEDQLAKLTFGLIAATSFIYTAFIYFRRDYQAGQKLPVFEHAYELSTVVHTNRYDFDVAKFNLQRLQSYLLRSHRSLGQICLSGHLKYAAIEERSRMGIDYTEREALEKFRDFKYLNLTKEAVLAIAYSLANEDIGESENKANILKAGNAFHYDFLNSFRRDVTRHINAFPGKFRWKCCSSLAWRIVAYTIVGSGFLLEATWNLSHLKHFTPAYYAAATGVALSVTLAYMPSFLEAMRWEVSTITNYSKYDRAFHALSNHFAFDANTQAIAQRFAYRALPQTKMETARFIAREMCLCFYKTPTEAEQPLLADGAGMV